MCMKFQLLLEEIFHEGVGSNIIFLGLSKAKQSILEANIILSRSDLLESSFMTRIICS